MANNLPKSKLIHEVIAEQDAIILGKTVLKESGKSLVADTEIAKIHAPGSDNQDLSNLVVKEAGKSLVADTEIAKIHAPGSDKETASSIATIIDGTDAKTPLVDTDTFPLTEPTTLKKTLWSTIKSTLKTYFDGLYLALTGGTLTGGLIIKPTTDAVNSISIQDKDGNVILSVDTVNNRVGVNTSAPDFPFTINGLSTAANITQFIVRSTYNGTDNAAFSAYLLNSTLKSIPFAQFSFTNVIRTAGAEIGSINFTTIRAGTWAKRMVLYGDGVAIGGTFTSAVPPSQGLIVEGNSGFGTITPNKKVEINSADGNNLRLTYNDNNGGAANYVDFNVSSSGDLIITPSGGDIEIGSANIHTTGALKGVHKANDGTNAVADGTYTVGIGTTTNGTITIKDGIITAVQQAT